MKVENGKIKVERLKIKVFHPAWSPVGAAAFRRGCESPVKNRTVKNRTENGKSTNQQINKSTNKYEESQYTVVLANSICGNIGGDGRQAFSGGI
ncbi:MAG: hypothetical protein K6F33_04550 [Bacteroidales bacterium]|nr:hypothetical protein [Bacteroidales bacterium]